MAKNRDAAVADGLNDFFSRSLTTTDQLELAEFITDYLVAEIDDNQG